jgi:hypothetical protein
MQVDTGRLKLLKQQLPVQRAVARRKATVRRTVAETLRSSDSRPTAIHEVRRQLDERAFYPAHDARKESPAYAKVHEKLCVTLDLPCLVCGVKHSTLNDPKENTYDARAMETHHHIVEWALANAIDVEHFNKAIRPNLAHRHQNDPEWHYEQPFDQSKVRDWVDHSEHNLWVLCDVHHRHKYLGIHELSYPIWCPQDLLQDDFANYVRSQVSGDVAAKKTKAGTRATSGEKSKARKKSKTAKRAGSGKKARSGRKS